MDRLNMNTGRFGDPAEAAGTRFAGLPFALGGQAANPGNSNGNGPAAFSLQNNLYPEGIALFNQFGQFFPQLNVNKGARSGSPGQREDGSRGGGPRPTPSYDGNDNDNSGKSSSAYASRHQAAEQRRRTRINERLDLLRKMVPHTDRANTASFLEEVIRYVSALKNRVAELETTLQAVNTGKQVPNGNAGGSRSDMQLSPDVSAILAQSGQGLQQAGHMNFGFPLQHIQQQEQEAIAALHEEQQQHFRQQLRQQQELAAARQTNELSDLATQLGLKTIPGLGQGRQPGNKTDGSMDVLNMLMKQVNNETTRMGLLAAAAPSLPNISSQQQQQQQLPQLPLRQLEPSVSPGAGHVAAQAALVTAAHAASSHAAALAEAAKNGAEPSPVSSEESGVPLKKRKVLTL